MAAKIAVLAPCSVERGVQGLADEFHETVATHKTPAAQRCDDCGTAYFPPLLGCRACASPRLSWVACGEAATVGTFVTVHTAEATSSMSIPRRLVSQIPYTSVYAIPDALPSVRLAALMVGPQQEKLAVGVPVRLEVANGRTLLASIA